VFGEAAFLESLSSRLVGLKVIRIGLALGDEIECWYRGLGPRAPWISRIDSLYRRDGSIYFVERSSRVPWPFAWVHHHHRFLATGTGTTIIDDVWFETRPALLGALVYPVLWSSFVARRGRYRARFGAP
jgi:ligand-binding SRPBCC domain-containing protein